MSGKKSIDWAEIGTVFEQALGRLDGALPYDLAAVLERCGGELRVRAARGRRADARVRAHRIALDDAPPLREALAADGPRLLGRDDHVGQGDPYGGVLGLPHGHACLAVPLRDAGELLGALVFDRTSGEPFPPPAVALAALAGELVAQAIAAARRLAALDADRARFAERERVIEAQRAPRPDFERSRSEPMLYLARMARRAAATDMPVLITGEPGVGKELLARSLHRWSARARGPFIVVNCAALAGDEHERVLFGSARGAFSGAVADRPGRLALAEGGTLLLEQIDALAPAAQEALLRVLHGDGAFTPVGADRSTTVDVRVVATASGDLEHACASGALREELFYALNVCALHVPPLRARREDIARLADEVLAELARRTGRGPWTVSPHGVAALVARDWPGNVRELVNVLERAALRTASGELVVDGEPAAATARASAPTMPAVPAAFVPRPLVDVEREHIRRVLEHASGKIYGDGGAAELLAMKPSTLQSRMAKHGIKRS